MGQKELIELIDKNPGIFQCDLVKLHGYNGSLIAKMARRGELIREPVNVPGHQNKTYKIWTAEQKDTLKLVDRHECIANKYQSTGAMHIQQRL